MKHSIVPVMRKHIEELFQILAQYSVTDRKTLVAVAEADLVFQKAVLMSVGCIGELSKKMEEDFKAEHSEINWRRLGTARNIIFHEYDIVDMDIISVVVFKDIAALKNVLEKEKPV